MVISVRQLIKPAIGIILILALIITIWAIFLWVAIYMLKAERSRIIQFCIMGKVDKGGHMYQSLKETKVCVLNFPSNDIYDRCIKTIGNNQFETDEITASGLTAEKASKVNAPRIKECFLNIECEFLWEHELFEGSQEVAVALKAVNICMDSERYDQGKFGRYGKSGFLFQVDQPTNPETGKTTPFGPGILEQGNPVPWIIK